MNDNLKSIFKTIEVEIDVHKTYELQHKTSENGTEFIITPKEEGSHGIIGGKGE